MVSGKRLGTKAPQVSVTGSKVWELLNCTIPNKEKLSLLIYLFKRVEGGLKNEFMEELILLSDRNNSRTLSSEVAGGEAVANFAQNVEMPEMDSSDSLSPVAFAQRFRRTAD